MIASKMSSEEETRKKSISTILADIGLGQYAQKFKDNMISTEQVQFMTADDFASLDITVLGIRLKIKEACQTYLKGIHASPVVSKFKELASKRRGKGRRNEPCTEKGTRRIYVGWKHRKCNAKLYRIVGPNDGGGKHEIDAPKEYGMVDLETLIMNKFFPNGRSEASGLDIKCLNYFIASFSGHELPTLEEFGGFTVGNYFRYTKSVPVRLYLHTSHKRIDETAQESLSGPLNVYETPKGHADSSEEELPNLSYLSGTTNSVSTGLTGNLFGTTSLSDLGQDANEIFVDAGTPTVSFRQSSLSLGHRRNQMTSVRPEPSRETSARGGSLLMQTEVIDILDDEDEEIQQAIQASLIECCEEEKKVCSTLDEVLQTFQTEAVDTSSRTKLIVFRNDILNSAIRGVNRTSINLKGKLFIKFSGEIGEDYGGPRREFFRLITEDLKNSKYFEGPDDSKVFTHNIDLLERREYQMVGRIVALALAQDGPGLHCFNEKMYDLMVGEAAADLVSTRIIMPEDLNQLTQELEDVDSEEKRDRFLSAHGDNLVDLGFGCPYNMTVSNKAELIYKIKKFYLFFRISAEITQFKHGMNEVSGAWDYIQENAEVFKPLFCYRIKQPCLDEIMSVFTVNYSINGSNARTMEDATIYAWELFLQAIEDKEVPVTFGELMSFVTGADHVPPCGFYKKIEIDFYSDDQRLPHVSTCALQMWLPRAVSPEKLSNLLVMALKESRGFLKV